MKRIAILGSTGSIGKQALDVIRENKDKFSAEILTSNNNYKLLIEQAIEFQPNAVVIANEDHYDIVREALIDSDIKVFAGGDALEQVVGFETIDIVLTALVGFAGLKSTVSAIRAKKHIALANKETLVVAGELITQLAIENRVAILPVDSEHSAIFQCLSGEMGNRIEKLYITGSGGPFRGYNAEQLQHVTMQQALRHPTWNMGRKITIDSATLMNKGLEVIEAKWLFGVKSTQIEVVIHPQSIVHSLVQFEDGSIKAQMGLPDMKLPIQYAFSYPQRLRNDFKRFNFMEYRQLTFEEPDKKLFKCLQLAYDALEVGGNMPCILNAANEVAVEAFLNSRIQFSEIPMIVEMAMTEMDFISNPSFNDLLHVDKITRIFAEDGILRK